MEKDRSTRVESWDNLPLTQAQIRYAADDAFASLQLYEAAPSFSLEAQSQILSDVVDGSYHRVLLDPFHFMDRYPVAKSHRLYNFFLVCLSDAILVSNPDDVAKVKEHLGKKSVPEHQQQWVFRRYISQGRIRRFIPDAQTVSSRVDAVVRFFQQMSSDFINDKVMKSHLNCMEHLRSGCLSDHPLVPLYTDVKSTSAELQKYRSARGSSAQEGYHRHLAKSIAATSLSPLTYEILMMDVTARWNFRSSQFLKDSKQFYTSDLTQLMFISNLKVSQQSPFSANYIHSSYWSFFVPLKPEKFGTLRVMNLPSLSEFYNSPDSFDIDGAMVEEETEDRFDTVSDVLSSVNQGSLQNCSAALSIARCEVIVKSVTVAANLPYPKTFRFAEQIELALLLLKCNIQSNKIIELTSVT
ncbi:hypothetical protein MIR68_011809 [Amoeboaphelidium protococcarum]|nr:hypothetical protein MIR68_011809 [Amoeboaphelidium protococcarum]